MLAGLAAGLAAPALLRAAEAEPVEAILARSGLGELTGFAVAAIDGGAVLEAHRGEEPRPLASVAKILTSLYALEALGPEFRFRTRLVATGPVEAGELKGDLALVGSGDPLLDTDALAEMAEALAAQGVRRVAGRFLVADGALPAIDEIDPLQPVDAGYNPAVSGMNLNFNRVYLEWRTEDDGPRWRFSAPGRRHSPEVTSVRGALVAGSELRHRAGADAELWELPAGALRGKGSRWLPVRAPGRYAGEVLVRLAAAHGMLLPAAEPVAEPPPGAVLVERAGRDTATVIGGMLHHSTNLTAEVLGLRAGIARGDAPATLAGSAAAMAQWARGRYGLEPAALVNHSGLGDASRATPAALVRVLAAERARLPGLLRQRPVADAEGRPLRGGVRVLAKTGTLYFATALAGYLEAGPDRLLGFAILTADLAARVKVPPRLPVPPPGARTWAARARAQEQALLRRWLARYG